MESALMTVPRNLSASASAAADLPLAVGPAIRIALGTLTGEPLARRHGDESELALGVGQKQQHRAATRLLYRKEPRHHVLRLLHLLLGDLDDDVARLHLLLCGRAVRPHPGDDHAFDRLADAVALAEVVGERGNGEPQQIF